MSENFIFIKTFKGKELLKIEKDKNKNYIKYDYFCEYIYEKLFLDANENILLLNVIDEDQDYINVSEENFYDYINNIHKYNNEIYLKINKNKPRFEKNMSILNSNSVSQSILISNENIINIVK